MAKVKINSYDSVAGLWADEYSKTSAINWESTDVVDTLTYTMPLDQTGLSGSNPGFVYIDGLYKPTITKEPSILQNYTVSNDVVLEITDIPGGYGFRLFLDGVSVWGQTCMGVPGRQDNPLTYQLPIIAAIKKEKKSV